MPIVSVNNVVVGEGDGFAEFVVRLDAPAAAPVSVNYAAQTGILATLAKGIASDRDDADFEGTFGSLTFAPGETQKTVRVPILDDTRVEGAEYFTLVISAPFSVSGPGATQIGRGTGHALIHDNDSVQATPFIWVDDVIVDESDGVARFVVRLGDYVAGGASAGEVRVGYATTDGSAQAGQDYVARSGTLTFAPGRNVATVEVPITNDSLREGVERFGLRLSGPVGATVLDADAVAEIGASDATAVSQPLVRVEDIVASEGEYYADVVVRLSAPALAAFPVDFAWPGTVVPRTVIPPSTDPVFAPGETTLVVRVALPQDVRNLPSVILGGQTNWQGPFFVAPEIRLAESLIPVASARSETPTVTVLSNDAVVAEPTIYVDDLVIDEKAGQAVFVLRLGYQRGEASSNPVVVDFATRDGSATAGSDYIAASGQAVFEPGQSVVRVPIDLIDDASAEGRERFALLLSNPRGAKIGDAEATADIALSDGTPLSRPLISVDDLVIDEFSGMGELVVRLSAPSPNLVSLDYRLGFDAMDRTEALLPQSSLLGSRLLFLPGETARTIRFTIVDDTVVEPVEQFSVLFSGAVNGQIVTPLVRVQVRDNDLPVAAPLVTVESTVVDERSATATFYVSLGAHGGQASGQPVSVTWQTVDGTARAGEDYLPANGTLVFAPGESIKPVTVDLINDDRTEPTERFTLELVSVDGGVLFGGGATATIAANDGQVLTQPQLRIDDAVVSERDQYVDLVVSLSAPSNAPLGFTLSLQRGTTDVVPDYVDVGLASYTFAPGETVRTVRVMLVDDREPEQVQHFLAGVSPTTTGIVAARPNASVTIVDNDAPVERPALYVRDAFVDERAGLAHFVVHLGRQDGNASNDAVEVHWATADGTAIAGQDYAAGSGVLRFAPGESAKTVSVEIADDPWLEPAERFSLMLSQAVGAEVADDRAVAVIGASDAASVARPTVDVAATRVAEGDGWFDLVVTLSAPASSPLLVIPTLGIGGTANRTDYAPLQSTLAFAPGETLGTVRIAVLGDTALEPDETMSATVAVTQGNAVPGPSVTVSFVDDDDLSRDVLSYGRSDDLYRPSSAADVIVETPGGGTDTVAVSWSVVLPAAIENALLLGTGALDATGNAAANLLIGNRGNNRLDGQAGIDTAVFAATFSQATVAGAGGGFSVTTPLDGTDSLVSIERLRFADQLRAFDTSPGGNTYLAYAMFNAGFNRGPDASELGRWTSQLDQLGNGRDLAQAMINYYAPGVPNAALVTHLWSTIVGTTITSADLATYVGLIESGSFTQASLLEFVATHPMNTVEIAAVVGQPLVLDVGFFPLPETA